MDTPTDTADAKTALRARIRQDRMRRLPDRVERDRAILGSLTGELDRRDRTGEGTAGSRAVAAFDPLPGEPGGTDLPEALAVTRRDVWLPVVAGPGIPLRWVKWRGAQHTRTGAFGIREPVPVDGDSPVTTDHLLAVVGSVIIPALAVGIGGARLGQGGGFYDRTFAASVATDENHDRLIAVVDHEEFGVSVPATAFDITVDVVVTDSGTFRTDIADGNVRS